MVKVVGEMKKRLQRKGARRGFTLVELLIVIIIIGILAGAMMLVAGTSRDSAEASRIISDLRNMKAASLMWMADNPSTVKKTEWQKLGDNQSNLDKLNKYLDRPLIDQSHPYNFVVQTRTIPGTTPPQQGVVPHYEAWLLGYKVSDLRDGVKNNLAKQAQSAGLFGGDATGIRGTNWPLTKDQFYKADDDYVWVVVQ